MLYIPINEAKVYVSSVGMVIEYSYFFNMKVSGIATINGIEHWIVKR